MNAVTHKPHPNFNIHDNKSVNVADNESVSNPKNSYNILANSIKSPLNLKNSFMYQIYDKSTKSKQKTD